MNYSTLYIVRHGTTEWNAKGLIQGHMDSPLTEEGKEIARNLAKKFKNIKFDKIYSSDLLRAQKTAEIIALEHDLLVETTKLLRERNFGTLEGKPSSEFKTINEILDKLTEEEIYTYKAHNFVDSDKDLMERFFTFIREVSLTNPGKTILLVTHGGIMRAALIKLGVSSREQLKHGAVQNGGYIKLKSDGVDFFVEETEGIVKK